jgi:isopenicillin N synthase-like dioxygenase
MREACASIGFMYVTGHGVPWDLVQRTLGQARRFFAQSLEAKLEISCEHSPNRGYFPMGGENLGEKRTGDLKEGVDIGRDPTSQELDLLTAKGLSPSDFQKFNRWPSALPGWKEAMDAYFQAMTTLGWNFQRYGTRFRVHGSRSVACAGAARRC